METKTRKKNYEESMLIAQEIAKTCKAAKRNTRIDVADEIGEKHDVDVFFCKRSMPYGGIGTITYMSKLKEIRIQLMYGETKYNYAKVAIIDVA